MTDTRQSRSSRHWLLIIILIAISLRVVAAVYIGEDVTPLPGTYDQVSYDRLAQRVIEGYGFTFDKLWWPFTRAGEPTAHWSFLYTLYLAAVYKLVGYSPLVARLIQAVLAGALMPWLVYRIGRRHFSQQVGLVAAAIMACYAYFVYYAATLMTENFYIIGILWVLDLAGQFGQAGESSPVADSARSSSGSGTGSDGTAAAGFLAVYPGPVFMAAVAKLSLSVRPHAG